MPYTPTNNPYIAGDPYMYDLKWIVKKIKKAIQLYEPLSKDFDELQEYVTNYLASLDIETEIHNAIQELIDTGALSQMILDAFNSLDVRVNKLESRTPNDFIYDYTKVGEVYHPNGAPVICCYDPIANAVVYVSQTDNGYSKIGFLAADNITPATSQNIALVHANDIDYCNELNVILLADISGNAPMIHTINPASLLPLGTFAVNGWSGGYVSAVACDNINNYIYLFGESADHLKYHVAKLTTDGNIVKQFDIILSISNGASQGAICIDGVFNVLYTPRGDYNGDGTLFYTIDFDKEVVKCSHMFNMKGECESATFINNDIYVYGFTPAEGSNVSFAECSILTQAPRAIEATILYVNENATSNGNGNAASPFNNLNSAFYTVLNSPVNARYTIRLESDIIKYINSLESYTPVNIYLNMNGHKWTVSNVVTFPNDSNIYIQNGTISTTTGNIDFQHSIVTLRGITLDRDTSRVSIRFYSCTAYIFGMVFNLNATDTTYGPLFVTEQSIVTLNSSVNSTTSNTNHVALVEQGVIINTRTISGLTTPIAAWTGGITLGV